MRFFPGKTAAWLEAKLDEINDELSTGKMTIAANSGDQGGSFQRETNLRSLQQQVLFDLHQTDTEFGWDRYLLPSTTRALFISRE